MKQIEIFAENSSYNSYQVADKGARLGNYIIDKIVFFFLIFLHALILDGWLGVIPEDGSTFLGLYFFFLYVMYHSAFEHFLRKTPGKYITKTIVLKLDGSKLDSKDVLVRNICRLIPLDPISFLLSKNGWHDHMSKTKVVYEHRS